MTHASFNTRLLQLFAQLSEHSRSFSVGDLAFEESVLTSFVELVGDYFLDWFSFLNVLDLSFPLTGQCRCRACAQYATDKQSVTWRRVSSGGDYWLVRLCELSTNTSAGLVEYASVHWAGDSYHTVPGCPARLASITPYHYDEYDKATLRLVLPPEQVEQALLELRVYNSLQRVGNEFFVPSALFKARLTRV